MARWLTGGTPTFKRCRLPIRSRSRGSEARVGRGQWRRQDSDGVLLSVDYTQATAPSEAVLLADLLHRILDECEDD